MLTPPAWHNLGSLLLTQTWQLALLIPAIWLAARCCARNRPHLAHLLWMLVLAKCLTPPLWSSPSSIYYWLQPAVASEPATRSLQIEPGLATADAASLMGSLTADQGSAPFHADGRHAAELPAASVTIAAGAGADERETAAWLAWLTTLWLAGVGLSAISLLVRWQIFRRRLRGAPQLSCPELDESLRQLARRLGVRQPVRLLVTHSRIGPAVIGLLRPVILLPAVLVEGRTPSELQPILAHELLHVRRGDLWLALAQTLAQSLWWFHPLVWWTGRLLNREAERSCDEEVIAELNFPPAQYAHSLLDVLERKRWLQTAPAFPGVRPVDITASRLERIMQLRQGCRKRMPGWYWGLLALIAAVTLPGGAFVAQAKGDKQLKRRAALSVSAPQPAIPPKVAEDQPEQPRQEFEIEVRFLSGTGDVLKQLPITWHALASPAASAVTGNLAADDLPAGTTSALQNQILATSVVTRAIPFRSAFLDNDARNRLIESAQAHPRLNLLQAPKIRVFDGQSASIQDETERVFVVGLPTVPGNDQSGTEAEPQVQKVVEGTRIEVRPTSAGKDVRLNCRVQFSCVRRVDKKTIQTASQPTPLEVEIPEVTTDRIEASLNIPAGQTVALGGIQTPEMNGEPQSLVILIRCQPSQPRVSQVEPPAQTLAVVDEPATDVAPQPTARYSIRVYPVADLVVPIPGSVSLDPQLPKATASDSAANSREERLRTARVNMRPLVELIRTTIEPDSWQAEAANPAGEKSLARGSIQPYAENLSLVVHQSDEVHGQIADLLAQLRQLLSKQVVTQIWALTVSQDDYWEHLGIDLDWRVPEAEENRPASRILSVAEAQKLLKLWKADETGAVTITSSPKVTLFNGQSCQLQVPFHQASAEKQTVRFLPVMNPAGDVLRIHLSVGGSDVESLMRQTAAYTLQGEQALLLDVTEQIRDREALVGIPILDKLPHLDRLFQPQRQKSTTGHAYLLVVPRILEVEEEEVRILPVSK